MQACKPVDEQSVHTLKFSELVFIDSIKIVESSGFLSRPSNGFLINDSLLGIESRHSKGVWIINTASGLEENSLIDQSILGTPINPTKVDWTAYPTIFMLNGVTDHIYEVQLSKNENDLISKLNKTKLDLPKGTRIMPDARSFWRKDNDFFVELAPINTFKSSNQFYKNSGKFIGVFDKTGKYKYRFLHYPKSLTDLNGFLEPGPTYSSGIINNSNLAISFPTERKLIIYKESTSYEDSITVNFPKSKYFNFNLPILDQEVSNGIGPKENNPAPHYFGEIKSDGNNVYLQSFMKDNENLEKWRLTSNILKYDIAKKEWTESINPIIFFNMGELAGVSNDTLYFVDAGMITKEDKYIKRAVLKPIEE
ncbi:hypothetical protein [Algoriphagus sp. NG3]|uniref:hypothetical protein n=1 Tax=Algoriphagus sp. NG3 TaxID=3097546 RepID=UPI002A8072C4|nr:hypothetical protein [Algoriphagus sp. NG3]WPR74637.1 hypothetical protein SLW71_18395 [Algoriphagus sp. NG3]